VRSGFVPTQARENLAKPMVCLKLGGSEPAQKAVLSTETEDQSENCAKVTFLVRGGSSIVKYAKSRIPLINLLT